MYTSRILFAAIQTCKFLLVIGVSETKQEMNLQSIKILYLK